MKTLQIILAAMAVMTTAAIADETASDNSRLSIDWQNPKEYTDMRAANSHRQRFRDNTIKELEAHIAELVDDLPNGQTLNMVVTDVDLAGRVWPGNFIGMRNPQDVRVVERIDIPRMNFSYELLDEQGKVIKQADVKLKDMGFQDTSIARNDHDSLRYEKRMLTRWFQREFNDDLVAKN